MIVAPGAKQLIPNSVISVSGKMLTGDAYRSE